MPTKGRGALYETVWGGATPLSLVAPGGAIWLGMYFKSSVPGKLAGLRGYFDTSGGTRHYGWACEDGQNQYINFCTFTGYHKDSSVTGWASAFFHPWLDIPANVYWVIAVSFQFANYGLMVAAHGGDVDTTFGHFTLRADTGSVPNGAYQTNSLGLFLPNTLGAAKPAIDILFFPD